MPNYRHHSKRLYSNRPYIRAVYKQFKRTQFTQNNNRERNETETVAGLYSSTPPPVTHYRRQNKWKISKPRSPQWQLPATASIAIFVLSNSRTKHLHDHRALSLAQNDPPARGKCTDVQTVNPQPPTWEAEEEEGGGRVGGVGRRGWCFLSFMPLLVISVQIDAASGIKYDKYKCIGFRADDSPRPDECEKCLRGGARGGRCGGNERPN